MSNNTGGNPIVTQARPRRTLPPRLTAEQRAARAAMIAEGQPNNYASWASMHTNEIMNKKSKNFAAGTKWGVKANKKTAKEWYNSTTGKLKNMSVNVYANNIGGDVFKPGQLKNLYFDATAEGAAARKLYTRDEIVGVGGVNPYTRTNISPRKLTTNMMNAIRESMKERGVKSTIEAKKILGKNATKAAIKKKAMNIYMDN